MQTHHFGNLKDTQGLTVRLPIVPPSIGQYKVFITNSEGARKSQNIEITQEGQAFEIHNYNGKKKFTYGTNIFQIRQVVGATSQAIRYNGAERFSIYFQKPDAVDAEEVETLSDTVAVMREQNILFATQIGALQNVVSELQNQRQSQSSQNALLLSQLTQLRQELTNLQDAQIFRIIPYSGFTDFYENGIRKSTHVFIDTMIENTLKVIRNGSFLHQNTDFVYDPTTKALTITPQIEDEFEIILYAFVKQSIE